MSRHQAVCVLRTCRRCSAAGPQSGNSARTKFVYVPSARSTGSVDAPYGHPFKARPCSRGERSGAVREREKQVNTQRTVGWLAAAVGMAFAFGTSMPVYAQDHHDHGSADSRRRRDDKDLMRGWAKPGHYDNASATGRYNRSKHLRTGYSRRHNNTLYTDYRRNHSSNLNNARTHVSTWTGSGRRNHGADVSADHRSHNGTDNRGHGHNRDRDDDR